MPKFIDSAILLAISTAVLFSWSTAHYMGFLFEADLDINMMERSFHQVIYNGLLLAFYPVIVVLIFICILLFFYAHIILPEYIKQIRRSYKFRKKIAKFRRYWIGKRVTSQVEKNAMERFNNFGLLTILSLTFLFSLVYFENEGKKEAQIIMEKVQNESEPHDMIRVNFTKKVRKLYFLGCGLKNCAGIEAETNKVFYFPQSLGFSFVYQNKI